MAKATAAVAKQEGNGRELVVPDGDDGLSGEMGSQDLIVPTCSLVQPMSSQDKGERGKFYFSEGMALDELNVAVLRIAFTRTMWSDIDEDIQGLNGPICKSVDRLVGLTNLPEFVTGAAVLREVLPHEDKTDLNCATCRFKETANFGVEVDNLRCRWTYTLLMVDIETRDPFLYFVHGMQMRSVLRNIITPARKRREKTGNGQPWLNAYHWKPRMVEEKRNYTVDITTGDQFGEEDLAEFAAMSAELRRHAEQASQDDEPAEPAAPATEHAGIGAKEA